MNERADASGAAFWQDADGAGPLQRSRTLVNAIDDGVSQLDSEVDSEPGEGAVFTFTLPANGVPDV